jgi:hypothetical protein
MAISAHRTLSEVHRYTADVDRKKLADSGHGEAACGADRERLGLQSYPILLRKPKPNPLKTLA